MAKEYAEQYARLSLNGRLAVALCCVEKFFRAKNISHVEIDLFLNWFWEALYYPNSSEGFRDWLGRQPPLVETSLGWEYPDSFEAFLAQAGQSADEFRWLIEFATDVYYRSISSRPQKKSSLTSLTEILHFVEKHGISHPDPKIFNDSNWDDYNGWGRRLTVDEARLWRKAGVGFQ